MVSPFVLLRTNAPMESGLADSCVAHCIDISMSAFAPLLMEDLTSEIAIIVCRASEADERPSSFAPHRQNSARAVSELPRHIRHEIKRTHLDGRQFRLRLTCG